MNYAEAYKKIVQGVLDAAVAQSVMRRARAKAGGHAKAKKKPALDDVADAIVTKAMRPGVANKAAGRGEVTRPIIDRNKTKRIVYCVALEPGVYDQHNDIMAAPDIENAAHRFLTHSRVIKSEHQDATTSVPVESYIAPQDLQFETGMYGKQAVKKGSWVIGIKINSAKEWNKVVNGEYTGVSVGGFGVWSDP